MFIVESFWAVFLIKKKELVLSKKYEIFAIYSIPQNTSFKLSKSKSLYNFSVFAPPEKEVAKSARSCTRKQAKACKAVGDTSFDGSLNKSRMVSRSKHIKMFQQYLPENTLENKF